MSYAWPKLMLGTRSPEVGNWQRFLTRMGRKDWLGKFLKVDEDFGQKTDFVTREWQVGRGLDVTGVVGEAERSFAILDGFIPFIGAKNYGTVYPGSRYIGTIVIHTMEAPEKPKTVDNVAAWFAGANAPMASAHYCVGQTGVVQCVRDVDVAWHAPGLNTNGIGVEHEGYAKQTKEEWADEASRATLMRSAKLVAALTRKYTIPIRKLSPQDVKLHLAGICGHVDVTNAFHDGKGHWDPGPAFPWDEYLDMVRKAL